MSFSAAPGRLLALLLLVATVASAGCRAQTPGPDDRAATAEELSPAAGPEVEKGGLASPGEPVDGAEPSAPPGTSPCAQPVGCYDAPRNSGRFDVGALPEASGLALSLANEGVLYLLDDARGTAVHAVGLDGTPIAVLEIEGMETRDGESLTTGPCGPERMEPWCLYIGDIGDNARGRPTVVIHRVPEPDLSAGAPASPLAADRAELRYPDGAHDAEALLVDGDGRVHVVTKAPFDRDQRRTGETRLYRADSLAVDVLTDLGALALPAPTSPAQSLLVGGGVTGGDHRDGRVLLRTYDAVYALVAPDGASDLATLAAWQAYEVDAPLEPQSEGLAIAADGCSYFTVGEMVGDIWLVPCRP